jgi:hypothetical protein
MILVVTLSDSPRLDYVINFIQDVMVNTSVKLKVVERWDVVIDEAEIVIAYGNDAPADRFDMVVPSCGLMWEVGLNSSLQTRWDDELNCLSFSQVKGMPYFDLFAAIFFLLSRYEEYSTNPLDKLGRYPSTDSAMVKANQHLKPWVNIWLLDLLNRFQNQGKLLDVSLSKNPPLATMDIDIAYEYLGRKGLRKWFGWFRDVKKPHKLLERIKVLLGVGKDPAFIFEEIEHVNTLYFIHVSNKSRLDKACGLERKEYLQFLQGLKKDKIGLHPSCYSFLDFDEMMIELEHLEIKSEKEIVKSRFHYIKMKLPYSYELLHELGIKDDYSMGWPDIPGYRAGTNFPFYFFNPLTNKTLHIRLTPFTWMDAHYIFSDKLDTMGKDFNTFLNDRDLYGGSFTPIFHNNHFQHYPALLKLVNRLCK